MAKDTDEGTESQNLVRLVAEGCRHVIACVCPVIAADEMPFVLPLQSHWTWGPDGKGAILLVNCDRDDSPEGGMDNQDLLVRSYEGEQPWGSGGCFLSTGRRWEEIPHNTFVHVQVSMCVTQAKELVLNPWICESQQGDWAGPRTGLGWEEPDSSWCFALPPLLLLLPGTASQVTCAASHL